MKGGYRFATSVGGVLTGRGAMTIIIDDPMKPSEAMSETQLQTVNDWYDQTLLSRLDSKKDGAIVLIMQRLHEHDLTGHVLGQEPWEHLRFPAIAEEDEEHLYMTPSGTRVLRRSKGDVLQPKREPREVLDALKRGMGSIVFAGQYQQTPVPQDGALVKAGWFRRYTLKNRPEHVDLVAQSWDTANKAGELNDYSVCTTWGIVGSGLYGQDVYLLDVFRKRLEFPDLKREVLRLQQTWGARTILMEDQASGTQLIQELNRDGHGIITPCKPVGDKVMRLHAQTATIEAGRVHIRRTRPGPTTTSTNS
jgi:predicted phage terminase large subunit-like protein